MMNDAMGLVGLLRDGQQAFQSGLYDQAYTKFRAAVAADAGAAAGWTGLGAVDLACGRHADAVSHFVKALDLAPGQASALFNVGMTLRQMNRLGEARLYLERAVATLPTDHAAVVELGIVHYLSGRFSEARWHFTRACQIAPDHGQAHFNLARTLHALGQMEGAEVHYRRALALGDDRIGALNNLAVVTRVLGRLDESVAFARQAVALCPTDAELHYNLGQALFAKGDWVDGAKECEWRWKTEKFAQQGLDLPQPRWDGGTPCGKVLLWREQGVGDEVMFAGQIPALLGEGLDCVVAATPRMAPLLARSLPDAEIVVAPYGEAMPSSLLHAAIAAQAPIGDLLGLRPVTGQAYLKPDSQHVAQLRARYGAGDGKVVGLAWHAASAPERGMALAELMPLLQLPGVRFVSLQYGDHSGEIAALGRHIPLMVDAEIDPLRDLDGFAAQVAAMDLVVSIDNSTVHFAGALGVPTLVLLPQITDWRWFIGDEGHALWDCVTALRQTHSGEWGDVVRQATILAAAHLGCAANPPRSSMDKPCRQYGELLKHYAQMHSDGYVRVGQDDVAQAVSAQGSFPGEELAKFLGPIRQMILRHNARSILDYGAGKASWYADDVLVQDEDSGIIHHGVASYWGGVRITLFEPALGGALAEESHDGVICLDVLEHCFIGDLPWIIADLFRRANRFVFANVACYPASAHLPTGENAHITIRPPAWWNGMFNAIAHNYPHVDWRLCCVADEPDRTFMAHWTGPVDIHRVEGQYRR